MEKQTAVDWLLDNIHYLHSTRWKEIIEEAKEMEKEQMIDFTDGYVDNCVIPNENMSIPTKMGVPQYYNETYNK